MDLSSLNRQQKVLTMVAATVVAVFLLVPLTVAWFSPFNASAADANASANVAVDTNAADSNTNAPGAENVGGAITSFWSLAWAKAWPFIQTVLGQFWTVSKKVLIAIWSVGKDVGTSLNANINSVNVPLEPLINAAAAVNAPVNAAP
jgi:hypothetical protein